MYRARQLDAEQNRLHYADPISCPVLTVGAQAYLGDAVAKQLITAIMDRLNVTSRFAVGAAAHRRGWIG